MSLRAQEATTCPLAAAKNKQQQEKIMKQTRTQDINIKTQTGSAPANGADALPIRRRRVFGGRLLPKAGILAVLVGVPLGTSLLTAGEEPHQAQYRFIAIPLPGAGWAVGINDEGLVTGFYTDPVTGGVLSFLFDRGELKTGISGPGDTYTAMGPANNFGVESGNDGDFTDQQPVFYDIRHGTFTPLPKIPGMPINFCDGLNDFGHASGVAYAGGNFDQPTGLGLNWIWDGRHYSFFTVPGAVNGAAAGGINDWDQVTGYYVDSSGLPKGFVKDGQHFTTFDAPGALYTLAFGINNLSVVTGEYVNPDNSHHGYFWSGGQFVTVDVTIPGSNGTLWYGSNDHGDLAGIFFTGADHVQNAVIAVRLDGDARRDR
jgi:hypothetical protein